MGLPVRQYAYFSIRSDDLDAAAIAARVGIAPDQVVVRGSREPDPPVARARAWKLLADDRDLRVDEQAALLLGRLRPVEAQVRELAADRGCSLTLQIVRYFADPAGEEQLLGWHLDADGLAFLARIGADIDVDEYEYG